jgi:endoglucanase
MTVPLHRVVCLMGLIGLLTLPAVAGSADVIRLDQPAGHAYGDFADDAVRLGSGVTTIRASGARGGVRFDQVPDLAGAAERVPVLEVRTMPGHQAQAIRVFFADGDGTRAVYTYPLAEATGDGFTRVVPQNPLTLGEHGGLDLASIEQVQLQGDWRRRPVHVQARAVHLVAQDQEMADAVAAQRQREQRRAQRQAQQQQDQARARETLLRDGVPADPQGPRVVHVGAVDRDILGIELEAGRTEHLAPVAYQPQPGDVIEPTNNRQVLARFGEQVRIGPKGQRLLRDTDGDGRAETLGFIIQPAGSDQRLLVQDRFVGSRLVTESVDAPQAYRVVSDDDERFADGVVPTAVHCKSRPIERGDVQAAEHHQVMEHKLYLALPHDMREGATYRVVFHGINAAVDHVDYTHRPEQSRSEAVHASHIGYRPGDPFKRAYLSLWLGTGGAHAFDEVDTFQLIDDAGNAVYTGQVRLGFAADQPEALKQSKNYAHTHVYWMDFHDFDQPGTYRVLVPGIGTSYRFQIADRGTWSDAFRTSMHGFLSHRSGIELGRPFTEYVRPRNMHPDDVPVYRSGRTRLEGEAGAINVGLREQLQIDGEQPIDVSGLTLHPDAWGGYMDAGDWDRRSQHMEASFAHMELLDLFPEFFEGFALALPPDEAENGLPDLLDEALFGIDLYRRLQEDHGGVGGGVESTGHPRDGEASWQETLLIAAFDPDPVSSYIYAANAARAARLLKAYDPDLAATYRASTVRAFDWAQANGGAELARYEARMDTGGRFRPERARRELTEARLDASVELYRLTREARYHDAFREQADAAIDAAPRNIDGLFAYAMLPDDLADPQLRQRARDALVALADVALEFQQGNAFGLASLAPSLPPIGYVAYWSAPEMVVGPILPRAYVLTGDVRYLRGALAAAHYTAGANPMNITLTTGVGHEGPTGVLHIDSRASGQPFPDGITVYGQTDPGWPTRNTDWAHQWHLRNMVPDSRDWPGHEAYVGINKWAAMNEYTITQTLRPTSYYWGFLAARPADAGPTADGRARAE